jgi:hypothetical protein
LSIRADRDKKHVPFAVFAAAAGDGGSMAASEPVTTDLPQHVCAQLRSLGAALDPLLAAKE